MTIVEYFASLAVEVTTPQHRPLRIFLYNGNFCVGGLFAMHDQMGFSLTDSLLLCARHGWFADTEQFIADALRAGWNRDKAERLVKSSLNESRAIGVTVRTVRDHLDTIRAGGEKQP